MREPTPPPKWVYVPPTIPLVYCRQKRALMHSVYTSDSLANGTAAVETIMDAVMLIIRDKLLVPVYKNYGIQNGMSFAALATITSLELRKERATESFKADWEACEEEPLPVQIDTCVNADIRGKDKPAMIVPQPKIKKVRAPRLLKRTAISANSLKSVKSKSPKSSIYSHKFSPSKEDTSP